MRISSQEAVIIKDTVTSVVGDSCHVTLFGSRVDDTAKGGDIDLLVEVPEAQLNRASTASRLAASLQIRLGDRRIDVILVDPATPKQDIHKHARQQGVRL